MPSSQFESGADQWSEAPRLARGATVLSGQLCPVSGWWECVEERAVKGGRKQFFREGERLPAAIILLERSLWQRLKGEQPTHSTLTVWRLVEHYPRPEEQSPESDDADSGNDSPSSNEQKSDDADAAKPKAVNGVQAE